MIDVDCKARLINGLTYLLTYLPTYLMTPRITGKNRQ